MQYKFLFIHSKRKFTRGLLRLKNEVCTTYKLYELQKKAFETFLQVITIEDLQMAKYCEGVSKCINPPCHNNPNDK
jgi:hypothetical protein